jgi:MFS family permease
LRTEAALADRNASVRAAARSWQKAGAIDEATLKAIEAAVPDDRNRVGPVFRVLLFVFSLIAINGGYGFAWLLFSTPLGENVNVFMAMMIGFGIALAALTEYQIGPLKRAQGGTEAATSFAALGFVLSGIAWFVFEKLDLSNDTAVAGLLLLAALLLAAEAWRWGYPFYAGVATASLLAALTYLPGGRLLWIVLALVAAPFLMRLSDSERLPPALRHSFSAILIVSLIGLYAAVHLSSFDFGLIELVRRSFKDLGPASRSGILRNLSIAATALVPVIYLAIAIRTRRYPFLIVGLGTAIASLVTLRVYVHLAPLWVVLTLSVAVALRRYLDSGPAKERGGFTAEPLFEDLARQRLLEAGAAIVSFSPEARTVHEEPKYAGGGGDFGGGGSNSEF